jgi:predicted tellurium resistance membrane protein TerC
MFWRIIMLGYVGAGIVLAIAVLLVVFGVNTTDAVIKAFYYGFAGLAVVAAIFFWLAGRNNPPEF